MVELTEKLTEEFKAHFDKQKEVEIIDQLKRQGLNEIESWFEISQIDQKPKLIVSSRNRGECDKVFPQIIEAQTPSVILFDNTMPDDWGDYAMVTFPLSDEVELHGIVTMGSYGGGLRTKLESLGYKQKEHVDIGLGKGKYTLE